jgi:multiple sugar transport system substrate-binding protein
LYAQSERRRSTVAGRDPFLDEIMRRAITRRHLLRLGAAVPFGAAALAAACGGGSETSGAETAEEATTTASAATGAGQQETENFEGLTIQVTTRPNLDQEVEGFKEAIVNWEQRTGGKVNFNLVPYEEIPVKYAGYLASEDDSVDVLYGLEALVGQYGPQLYLDLTDKVDTSDFVPAAIEVNSVGGKLYGVPAHSEMAFFIYNKAYFEAAGLDPESPPATWAELYEAAPALNADGHTANATTLLFPAENLMFFAVFLNSTDTTLLSEDLMKVNFQNDEGLLAFQTWSDGISSGFFDKSLLNSAGELYDTGKVFNNGKTASMINYVELWGDAIDPAQSKVADAVGTSIMPGCKPGKTGSVNGFECFGVSRFSKNPEAALSFIMEMTGPNSQKIMTLARRYPSSRISVLSDPEVEETLTVAPLLVEQGQSPSRRPGTPYYSQMEEEFAKVLTELSQGSLTPEQAMEQAATNVQKVIDEYFA